MKKILFSAVVFAAVFPLFLQGESLVDIATGNFFADVPPRASVFGKYAGLKQRFHCPDTLYKMSFHNNLRNFHDLGLYEKTETWCGTKLQPGFIVYYGGTWYVWEKQVINKHSEQVLATMNGTYTGLLKKKYCRHMKTKGRFIEFGYLTSPMCDNPNKSDTGFFVYVQPYVYIYTNKILPLDHVPAEVSVNGHYSDLFNIVRCDIQGEQKHEGIKMKESRVVLEFDEEEQRSRLWPDQCGESLGPGHYVYQYPCWYVWRNRRNPEDEPGE